MSAASKTPKSDHFVEEYLSQGCAKKAAQASGISLDRKAPKTGCYVYLLLCPQHQRILYVGKGTGNRMHHHVRDARNGVVTATKKFKALCEFLSNGYEPVAVVLTADLTSREAIRLERRVIASIGLDNLANALPGQTSMNERLLHRLSWLSTKRKPFCRWLDEVKPSPDQIGSYAEHVAYLKGIENKLRHAAA